jgi:hypothetical protein
MTSAVSLTIVSAESVEEAGESGLELEKWSGCESISDEETDGRDEGSTIEG